MTQFLYLINLIALGLLMCQADVPEAPLAPDAADADSMTVPDSDSVVPDTIEPQFDLTYLMGKFDPTQHPDFVLIDTLYADRAGLYLRKETYTAFRKMYDAARQDGIRLQIRSATRTFGAQKYIWERKWNGETTIENGKSAPEAYPDAVTRARMILKYSSMPGSSRHHWGTDIDLNAFDNSWFDAGPGLEIYQWLVLHAAKYGFCQPYTKKGPERPYGYEEERWHWSYLPLAKPLTQFAADQLKEEMIGGFAGAGVAHDLHIVEHYVLGINPECLND